MQMYISSIPFAVVTWNGTEGKDVSLKTQVVLFTRNGVMRAHFSGGGVKLKKMIIRYLRPFTEDDAL
jgi:beta-glucosidase